MTNNNILLDIWIGAIGVKMVWSFYLTLLLVKNEVVHEGPGLDDSTPVSGMWM